MTRWDYSKAMKPLLAPGQQELRENLRAAIADSGRSQSAVCMDAGLVLYHLAAPLSGSNWMPRERVEALASALDLSVDELMGSSMFKGETWLDARNRRGGIDWRDCPAWCSWRGEIHGVYCDDNDGRTTACHYGKPWGSPFWISLEYDEDTGEEVNRTAALHPDDRAVDEPDIDLAELAQLGEQAESVARWLRGEVVLA